MAEKFQRTKFRAYVKLGSKQRSKRRYKRPTGRHNKIRQKWKSRPSMVEIGYRTDREVRGLINDKTPILIRSIEDLKNVQKNNIVIVANIGLKSKIELAKELEKRKIEVYNLNLRKFLKNQERLAKKKQESKKAEKTKEESKAKDTERKETKIENKSNEGENKK